MTKSLAAAAAALMISAGAAIAQQPPAKAKPAEQHKMGHMEHAKEQEASHTMSPWKELDAYHMLMMATWHPAKDKGDMAPTRAKIGEMVASAKTLAASPAPKGCDSPKLKAAATALPIETQGVADLVAKKADDAALKNALKDLHEKFDVLEEGCVMPKGMKH
jgi:hypothetical protein